MLGHDCEMDCVVKFKGRHLISAVRFETRQGMRDLGRIEWIGEYETLSNPLSLSATRFKPERDAVLYESWRYRIGLPVFPAQTMPVRSSNDVQLFVQAAKTTQEGCFGSRYVLKFELEIIGPE